MQTYRLLWGGVLMGAVVAWVGWGTPQALAQQSRVPRTGQTTCLDAAGSPINCTGTGQDGAIQAGVPSPNPRFSDTKDGTVKDNLTNLIWLKNAECFGPQTWASALNAANTLASGACGLSDGSVAGNWRVPNVREVESLIDFGTFNPALPSGHPFSGVQPAVYWSSTTIADDPGLAWGVSLVVGSPRPIGKADTSHVWPVRGGETSGTQRDGGAGKPAAPGSGGPHAWLFSTPRPPIAGADLSLPTRAGNSEYFVSSGIRCAPNTFLGDQTDFTGRWRRTLGPIRLGWSFHGTRESEETKR